MRPLIARTIGWTLVYLTPPALALLVAAFSGPPAARGFWVEFGVALGFVALAMFVMQFALTARFRRIAPPVGLDAMMQFHRQAGVVAGVYALGHPLVLILADRSYLAFYNPFDQFARAGALLFVTFAIVALLVTTLRRKPLRIPYEWWRYAHIFLAVSIVFVGLVHVQRVGHYVSGLGPRAFWVVFVGLALFLTFYTRLLKPRAIAQRPYRVADVRKERGRCWTLTIEPVGHDGLGFRAGQFVWLTLGDSPYSMREHPFTIASSAERRGAFELTIKQLGDATNRIGQTPVGTAAYVDGPHGRFTLDDDAPSLVFIAGGVGVTPMMSMLRTLRDRGDARPCTFIYGASSLNNVVYREELESLRDDPALNLDLVLVPEVPPREWGGESGMMRKDVLARHIDDRRIREAAFYICGPEPMMDLVERWLRGRGAPLVNIRSERFSIV